MGLKKTLFRGSPLIKIFGCHPPKKTQLVFAMAFSVKGSIFKRFPLKLAPYDFNHLAFATPTESQLPNCKLFTYSCLKSGPESTLQGGSYLGLKTTLFWRFPLNKDFWLPPPKKRSVTSNTKSIGIPTSQISKEATAILNQLKLKSLKSNLKTRLQQY